MPREQDASPNSSRCSGRSPRWRPFAPRSPRGSQALRSFDRAGVTRQPHELVRPHLDLASRAQKTSKAEAAYVRIARVLGERIHCGEYQPGGQLPNERQLAKEFGVSLMTLSRAMQVLAERGLTSSQQGRGTFVRSFELGQAVFGLHQWSEQWTCETTQVKFWRLQAGPPTRRWRVCCGAHREKGHCSCGGSFFGMGSRSRITGNTWCSIPGARSWRRSSASRSLEGLLQSAAGPALSAGRLKITACSLKPEEARLLAQPKGAARSRLEHLFTEPPAVPSVGAVSSAKPTSSGWRPRSATSGSLRG